MALNFSPNLSGAFIEVVFIKKECISHKRRKLQYTINLRFHNPPSSEVKITIASSAFFLLILVNL